MKRILSIILFVSIFSSVFSQMKYSGKVETGLLINQFRAVQVDPGPGWQGYNLGDDQNGFDLNLINGLDIGNKVYAGLGLGYLNFEGISGLSIFSDVEFSMFNSRLTPIVNLKLGYSHIWNQYENGTGTGIIEILGGFRYAVVGDVSIYLKSGVAGTQQTVFLPVKLGIKF